MTPGVGSPATDVALGRGTARNGHPGRGPDTDADVEAFLAKVDERLGPHFQAALTRLTPVNPLRAGVASQVASGGKRLRAALCVASCELFGTPYTYGLDFAAAIEHIHNFTLVHDDIADGDEQRRSSPSMWKCSQPIPVCGSCSAGNRP